MSNSRKKDIKRSFCIIYYVHNFLLYDLSGGGVFVASLMERALII